MASISKTPAVLSSEILIKSSGYSGWFILLEGDFDQRFWTSRVNGLHLKPINCVGKVNLLGTLALLGSLNNTAQIVALADKDYDEVLKRLSSFSGLVYTDQNDLEVTLLCRVSNGITATIERILSESVDVSKLALFEKSLGVFISEHLRQVAAKYGVLRLINEQLTSGVNFNDFPILHNQFFDHSNLQLDMEALQITFLNAVNKSEKVCLTELELKTMVEQHRANGQFSGLALVQGHDLMQLLAAAINSSGLRRSTGHKQASEDSLARDLCLMIHRSDLQTTSMFQDLSKHAHLAGLTFFA